jgi:hypothetical protein
MVPSGGNQVFVDGSAQWIKAQKMVFLHSWAPSARTAYWYQDSADMDSGLLDKISKLQFGP